MFNLLFNLFIKLQFYMLNLYAFSLPITSNLTNFICNHYKNFYQMDRIPKINQSQKLLESPDQPKKPHEVEDQEETSCHNQIEIGLVTIKPGIPKKLIQTIIKDKKQKLFKSEKWIRSSSKINPIKETQLYRIIDKIAISQLEYTETKLDNILNLVQQIDFKNLTKLSLSGNFIKNIEPLTFLKAENLAYLDLGNNSICQSKSLNKLNQKKLKYLEICNNPLFQLKVERLKLCQEKIYTRLITHPSGSLIQHVGFLAKLEQNVVSCVMEFDLKYYNGQSHFGFSFDRKKSEKKLIIQKKICQTLKQKLTFQKN